MPWGSFLVWWMGHAAADSRETERPSWFDLQHRVFGVDGFLARCAEDAWFAMHRREFGITSKILKGSTGRQGRRKAAYPRTAKPSRKARATGLRRQGAKGLEPAPGGPPQRRAVRGDRMA